MIGCFQYVCVFVSCNKEDKAAEMKAAEKIEIETYVANNKSDVLKVAKLLTTHIKRES